MKHARGISSVAGVFILAFAALLCPADPAVAQADPVTLLDSFPADQRPEIVANVDGRAVYADHLAGSLYATDGTPGGAALLQSAGKAMYAFKTAYMVYEKSPAYITGDEKPYGQLGDSYLWKTDGTPEGTALLSHEPSKKHLLIGALGDVMFFAKTENIVFQVWKTNGTPDGTQLVKEFLTAGTGTWRIEGALVKDGKCYFGLRWNSSMSLSGCSPWITDGTANGTEQLVDWIECLGESPRTLLMMNGQPLYLAHGIYHSPIFGSYNDEQLGPWIIPLGTTQETTPLPSPIPSLSYNQPFGSITQTNGRLFYLAAGYSDEKGVWVSDGTPAGTQSLKSLRPDLVFNSSYFTGPVALGDAAYFTAYEATVGYGLWRTDGTAEGTTLVKAMENPLNGTDWGQLDHLQVSGGLLYFRNSYVDLSAQVPRNLWRSDGTAEGTFQVGEVYTTLPYTSPEMRAGNSFQSFDLDGVLYYFAKDADHGMELWRSSGTPETTVLCEDLLAGPDGTLLSTPALVGRNVLFTAPVPAKEGAGGMGLWSMPHPLTVVPNVVGVPSDQALAALEKADLTSGTMGAQYGAIIPKDAVISQSVAAGVRVPRDTAVDLVVSLGPEPVVEGEGEPQLEGEPQIEGEPQLEGEPQIEGEPPVEGEPQVEGEPNPEGEVPVLEGEPEVEGEPIPPLATVPDLTSTGEDSVQTALASAGFVSGSVTHAYSDTVLMGGVVAQEPPAGAQAAPGSAVNLVISLGPEPAGCLGGHGSWVRTLGELLLSGLALFLMGAFHERF